MRSAAQQAQYCRLTVLAPGARVDVALPVDVPVAELVPMLLELVGEPLFGLRPEPWRLSGAAGAPLPPGATLAQLGVPDGELLRLAPDAPPPPPPVFDDPVDALAASAGGAGTPDRRFAAAAVLVVAAVAATLLATGPADGAALRVAVSAVAGAALVLLAARFARRARASTGGPAQLAARAAALAAVPFTAAAGWAALPAASPAGPLLLATAAAGVVAAVAQLALRVVAPALVAVVVAAVPVGSGAVAVLRFAAPPTAVAAAVAALMVVVGPLLPRAALRLSGLPRPVVPADGSELADADDAPDLLPPEEFAERSDLARGYLAGLVGGCAAVAAAGALVAATDGGWAGPTLAAVVVAVLALRARGFADAAPSRTLLGSAVIGLIGLAGLALARPEPQARILAVGVLLVVVVPGLLAVARSRPAGSPVSRRAVDLFDGLLCAATVPLAFAAMDLFRLLRGL
ncbi:type VII secretion integral membrane protein EccD [Pseudonocardia sp. MH-G8]|uniref:type VII secretion integral membrane protein EccD n=1 Tax=Pseudonocardia sp. MH-G8 TaxID=1854588 RepID=UPI000BA0A79F|nr:type VII secretion integral membrane protein EccD [Pseudonocardia sp. MH-G8]OZM80570.1 type VII secretion integral membrane protein EccD [Pseudonocardia sp. MH-G8]